jgi:acyl-CoA dehydrogenase
MPAAETAAGALETVRSIANDVAAPAAAEVDRDARFPREAVDALKRERLLAALVPMELGGLGHGLSEVARHCEVLGRACASTAMVYAMHQIQVACLVRHGAGSPFFRRYLAELAERQYLIASVTSEVGVGGDLRTSIAAVDVQGECFTLDKDATTISYGAESDDLLVTARRAPEATGNDQVLVLVRRSESTLEQTASWDTLGMRGTCSPSFRLKAGGERVRIVPEPFDQIATSTMVPASHILWASCWLGIAAEAVGKARAFVRGEARKKPGSTPPTASRLAEVSSRLQTMRAGIQEVTREYEAIAGQPDAGRGALSSLGFALRLNNLKVAASEQVVEIVTRALRICGIAAYKNDTPLSLGRHLRDAHSAALMIGNDRIYATNASLLLVYKDE